MKLQRTTLILVLLALGLGAFVYFSEIRGTTQQQEAKNQKQQIFSFAEDDIQSLAIKTNNISLNLERNGKSQESKWLLKSPTSEPANTPIVSYLTDLLVKGKSDHPIQTPVSQLAEFGLDQPKITINISLKNQKTHQLILGKTDFSRRFLYAQVDPIPKQNGNVDVLLVSTDFENAVNRDISEWQQSKSNSQKTPLPASSPLTTPLLSPKPLPTGTSSPTSTPLVSPKPLSTGTPLPTSTPLVSPKPLSTGTPLPPPIKK
jgi:Domain of unknown function (DUF4340)